MRFHDQGLSTGTGFIVEGKRGPYLVTNRHNVTGRRQDNDELLSKHGGVPNTIRIFHNKANQLGAWISRDEPLYDGEKPLWKEHPTLKHKADFVALKLTSLQDVAIYPYKLSSPGPNILLSPADIVSVIGFPFGIAAGGLFAVWATGFLASEPEIDYDDMPIQLIDCRSRPGQSGSPVVAYRSGGAVALDNGTTAMFAEPVSSLIGIYSGRINAESDLGIVWKSSAVKQLIDGL